MTLAHLTDSEVADICRPLIQHAAQVRFLRGLGVPVERRPDGSPLVRRADWDRHNHQGAAAGPRWSKAYERRL